MAAQSDDVELGSLFDKREQLLLRVAFSAASLISPEQKSAAAVAHAPASPGYPLDPPAASANRPQSFFAVIAFVALVVIGATFGAWFWPDGAASFALADKQLLSTELDGVVERIIAAESHGADLASQRSSAAGPAQFLAGTWVEVVRSYRPDLVKGRSQAELLSMRRDPKLARYMTKRLLEKHAAMLRRHRLPVTASSLYFGHFAGGAGAVAVLTAPKGADAALVLAQADASGKTTREKIAAANPFLEHYTIGDLEGWADRKMGQRPSTSLFARLLSGLPLSLATAGESGWCAAVRCSSRNTSSNRS